jgi:osmotically-inducible protein OsmY
MQDITDDQQTQQHVENALDWAEPCVDASRIRVTVDRGRVTLRGDVSTAAEKATAERVTLLLHGVKDVANVLTVSPAEWPTSADSGAAWTAPRETFLR